MAESNFVDYVKISFRSGNGGPGSRHMRRENLSQKVAPMVVMAAVVDILYLGAMNKCGPYCT